MSELWEVFGSYTVVPQPSWRLSNPNPAHFPSGDWHTLPLTFMVFRAAFSVCAPPIGNQVRYFTNLLKMVFMKYGFTSKGQEYSCMLEYRQGSATSSPYHQCWKIKEATFQSERFSAQLSLDCRQGLYWWVNKFIAYKVYLQGTINS